MRWLDGITNSEFTQTHVRVSDVIQPSHPLSSPSPPAPNPLSIRVFSNKSTLHMRWPKYWSFSFSIIPSKEIPGRISFRMDWLDLLAGQGGYFSCRENLLLSPLPSPATAWLLCCPEQQRDQIILLPSLALPPVNFSSFFSSNPTPKLSL